MSEPSPPDAPRFFVSLESLRGLAALAVVVYHAVWTNPVTELRFFQNGALMVDFFFVLSGFVIFHSYGRKLGNLPNVGRFLWLRIGRLYPLHLAFLLVFLAFEVAKFVAEKHLGIVADKPAFTVNNGYSFVTNLLLIHSLGLHHSLTYNYPSWSISTEFYAYVLFAAVRSMLGNDKQFAVGAVLIVVACTAILFWQGVVPLANAGFDWGFFRCCGGFFLGTLTYYIYSRVRSAGPPKVAGRCVSWLSPLSLLATIAFLASLDPEGAGTYALPILSAFVILSVVLWPQPALQKLLSSGPLSWLGKIELADGHGVVTPPAVGVCVSDRLYRDRACAVQFYLPLDRRAVPQALATRC